MAAPYTPHVHVLVPRFSHRGRASSSQETTSLLMLQSLALLGAVLHTRWALFQPVQVVLLQRTLASTL